jgi:hypothetical protein
MPRQRLVLAIGSCFTNEATGEIVWVKLFQSRTLARPATRTRAAIPYQWGPVIVAVTCKDLYWAEIRRRLDLYDECLRKGLPIQLTDEEIEFTQYCLKRIAYEEDIHKIEEDVNKKSHFIVNVDYFDDDDPPLYIQRYVYPNRTYQVMRKAWDEEREGVFDPNPDLGEEEKYWNVSILLTSEFDPEDEFTEVFALVYLNEENPPVDDPEECNDADPQLLITYDHEDSLYKCEAAFVGHESFGEIAEPFLDAAIDRSVEALNRILTEESKNRS